MQAYFNMSLKFEQKPYPLLSITDRLFQPILEFMYDPEAKYPSFNTVYHPKELLLNQEIKIVSSPNYYVIVPDVIFWKIEAQKIGVELASLVNTEFVYMQHREHKDPNLHIYKPYFMNKINSK